MIQKIQNLKTRSDWLYPFMKNRLDAICFLFKARAHSMAQTKGHYNDTAFSFRGCDLSAIKEVLADSEYAFLEKEITQKEAPIVLDVGAHIGTFALWALNINPQTVMLSVEADPETFSLLSNTVQNAPYNSWTSLHKAAWKNSDTLSFSNEGDSMSHKVLRSGNIEVNGISLADLVVFSGHSKIDLMKVDIEGAEEAFICEFPGALENIEAVVIELHPQLCDTDKVRSVLKNVYPNIEEIGGRISSKPLLYCSK